MPRHLNEGKLVFYRTVEALLEQDPVKEHRYVFDAEFHAQVYRTARDIVAIAHASAKLKEVKTE